MGRSLASLNGFAGCVSRGATPRHAQRLRVARAGLELGTCAFRSSTACNRDATPAQHRCNNTGATGIRVLVRVPAGPTRRTTKAPAWCSRTCVIAPVLRLCCARIDLILMGLLHRRSCCTEAGRECNQAVWPLAGRPLDPAGAGCCGGPRDPRECGSARRRGGGRDERWV